MLKIIESQDGSTTIFSEEFGVSYHSKYGALRESRHVFIEAGMFHQAIVRKEIAILEMGFGSGLNAFLTMLEADRLQLSVKYTGVEHFPLEEEFWTKLNYPEMLNVEKVKFEEIHKVKWGEEILISPYFHLTKLQSDMERIELTQKFDVIYFDAFAPQAQPELWEKPLLKKCFEWLNSGGVFVTYCAKGDVKRALRSIGFGVKALKGPPGKREMIRAIKP